MAFGIYVHIPYCLQRCVYCDFATFEVGSKPAQILPPKEYAERVKKEIRSKAPQVMLNAGARTLNTLYFGGGTPSLVEPEILLDIVKTIKDTGFEFAPDIEITIEINPATLNESKIMKLVEGGFNRFSVGAQSFDDNLLKIAHRKHSSQDTVDTLSLLARQGLNYSLDVLFALPTQTLQGLKEDLQKALEFSPPHVSPYCLTVPESNPMAKNRPTDDTQVEMFELIESELKKAGHHRYEISNFAKPGFESRHNLLYWNDDEYWGVGLSAHSYLHRLDWGTRFWNSKSMEQYNQEIQVLTEDSWSPENLDESHGETLTRAQALTDYFHTSLRMPWGLDRDKFKIKFKNFPEEIAEKALTKLTDQGLLDAFDNKYSLTPRGILLSNRVFEELTFLPTAH